MNNSEILRDITKRGTHVRISPGTVDHRALAHCLMALRVAGHAIVAEETFDHQHSSLGVTITHYLTCTRCP